MRLSSPFIGHISWPLDHGLSLFFYAFIDISFVFLSLFNINSIIMKTTTNPIFFKLESRALDFTFTWKNVSRKQQQTETERSLYLGLNGLGFKYHGPTLRLLHGVYFLLWIRRLDSKNSHLHDRYKVTLYFFFSFSLFLGLSFFFY